MRAWKRLGGELLVADRWLRVRADRCDLPSGMVLDPYYVLEEPEWVHAVAVAADGKLLTVRQFRYAAGIVSTEFPGGVVDADESPLDAAKRELREETGFEARDWRLLGATFPNPARQTNRVHAFVARELSAGTRALEPSEDIEHEFLSVLELKAAIASGSLCQSMHIASFYMALESEGLR